MKRIILFAILVAQLVALSAATFAQSSMKLKTADGVVYNELGVAYAALGRGTEAAAALEMAVQLLP